MSKPRGYWASEDTVVAEARKVMKEHELDRFPSQKDLKELGHLGLASAIQKYHGGFHEVRKLLGEDINIKSEEVDFRDPEYALDTSRQLVKDYGLDNFNQRRLTELGYSSLANAIQRYHGGFHKFKKILGE